jgi:hypothetical protein
MAAPRAVPRTLTERELNRALLARQLLLGRERVSLPRGLERIGGIQAQYAPSMYIGLWSRIAGFERGALTRALERKTVIQGTLMRITIHLVSARDYWPFALALRDSRRASWLRYHRGRPSEGEVAAAAKHVRRFLRDGPRRRGEIDGVIGKNSALFNGVGLWLDLVRVPPSGTWEQRRADLYAAAEDWLGPADANPDEGLELLVRRYLSGFGPASRKDIGDFAGLGAGEIDSALERLRLRRFRAEDGTELVDLPRAPLPDADTPAPVRFLPTWDATLLVHARRTQILPEPYRPLVFSTKTPHSVNTFLVDGAVAGTWREERGRVRLEPFEPLPRAARREVEEEAARLEQFLA